MSKKTKPKAIIIDVDGTLANCEHRRHFVERFCNCSGAEGSDHFKKCNRLKPKDWDSFFGEMKKDKVNQWCKTIIKKFLKTHKILFVTGRSGKYARETVSWIRDKMKIESYNWYHLYMRPIDDRRDDDIVKKEIYYECIEKEFDVEFVIEDRDRIVKMWRSIGLTCLQCARGDF